MKRIVKLKFWSFLVFGFIFLLVGVYLFTAGKVSEGVVTALVIAGTGQLVIFTLLLFVYYGKHLTEKLKK
jgi:hypothetical protein